MTSNTGIFTYLDKLAIFSEKKRATEFYFWYNCSNRAAGKFHYNDFMNIQSYFIPAAMIIMYVAIYVKIRILYRGSDAKHVKQEVKYLMQTVLIGLLIIVEVVAFVTLPFLNVSGYGQFYLNILLNMIIIANNLVTPIVLFTFNSEIRKHV
ncbi:hypothetical protein GCK32_018936, partial [Trichostrongylus colubriformis]